MAHSDRVIARAELQVAAEIRGHLATLAIRALPVALFIAIAGAATTLRVWQLDALGFNSDEAVYAGQAAAIAGVPELKEIFPIFRAHPLLYQYLLAVAMAAGMEETATRVVTVAVGIGTVGLAFLLGRVMYGIRTGVLAALFMALMPYHVVVTRQVLLDGPMVFCSTLALYLVAKFAATGRATWLYAAGGALGLTFNTKETGIILLGAVYAFLALSPEVRLRVRDLVASVAVMVLVIAPFPISLYLAGGEGTSKAGSYFVWQLFRRANHDWIFYPATVPAAIGFGVVIMAALGLVLARRWFGWREKLLVAWIIVPVAFFQLWPVKGFQYLLPASVPIAVLGAFAVVAVLPATIWAGIRSHRVRCGLLPAILGCAIASSLALTSAFRIQVAVSGEFLAGSGGVPGGREAGLWIREHVPRGATLMTVGPSMANILQFHGHRRAFGLSVSPNPLQRNPSYQPIDNPDLEIRSGNLQYVVWDSFSAARSSFFADRVLAYAERYHGRIVHTESVTTTTPMGETASVPVIVIYEVRP
jgi:4-amino-4-deoxy-L-arabinose transferase-like glycosyltransferase